MLIKRILWTSIVLHFLINFTLVAGNYRGNLASHHPCYALNKRLEPYIQWTEKLVSSQYKVQRDACGYMSNGPACCTNEILHSYEMSLGLELKRILDNQLNQLTKFLAISKQQIESWSKEYIKESRRLTISSLERLFGTAEYRRNVNDSLSLVFEILSDVHASVDDVSRKIIDLFHRLIISLYRRFMIHDDNIILDDDFQKCVINKAFDIEALPKQLELLYTLTSYSSLIQIFHTLIIYIDADVERLKLTSVGKLNQCVQRYSRETLCPMCIGASSMPNKISDSRSDINDLLCEKDCHFIIKTCFDQTQDPYVAFSSLAKNYSDILKEVERAVNEFQLVERLSKLHIHLYDMVVNATNSRRIYKELQIACPNQNIKQFSPIVSLPPTINERRELVVQWNKSLHNILKQTQRELNNLTTKLAIESTKSVCSNSHYAITNSNRCMQIDKQSGNVIQWPLSSSSTSSLISNHAELTRNQLAELRKMMAPVQQMIASLQPKKKHPLIQELPDFESYDDYVNPVDDNSELTNVIDTYDMDVPGSLSEQLYNEIDRQTATHRSVLTTSASPKETLINSCTLMSHNLLLYLTVIFIHQLWHIR